MFTELKENMLIMSDKMRHLNKEVEAIKKGQMEIFKTGSCHKPI